MSNTIFKFQVKCRWIHNDGQNSTALEVITNPTGIAWLHVDNIKEMNGVQSEIKRYIRHVDSYVGGGTYGDFGGHDITLVQLAEAMKRGPFICLPSPHFDDTRQKKDDSILVGYGRYMRTKGQTCETNRQGKAIITICILIGQGVQLFQIKMYYHTNSNALIGRYYSPIYTNRWGEMKYHYCDKEHGLGSKACKNTDPPQVGLFIFIRSAYSF